jgi:hypothetical protein
MAGTEHPLVVELAKVQYDLTALKVRVSEIQRQVAALGLALPDEHRCDDCGVVFRSESRLAEHRYTSHEGPDPAHWIEAEARSADDASDQSTDGTADDEEAHRA